ncbi:MAG: hypothetical protein AB8B97_16970 [Granulosicoccus sp.]
MPGINKSGTLLAIGFCVSLSSAQSVADVLVFEPSIALDQRFDDNYFLSNESAGSLSATRAVGELGLSSQSETYVIRALARIDSLLTTSSEVVEEGLDNNYVYFIDLTRRHARGRYGIKLQRKLDTPSRDIAADISEQQSLAEDTGQIETQTLFNNVAREERSIQPTFEFDITRRLQFEAKAELTDVEHDRSSPQDVIYQRYLDSLSDGEVPLPYNSVTIDNVGVFTPSGELDDFEESELELGLKYKLSPIVTVGLSAAYTRFKSLTDPNPLAVIPFEDLIPDPAVPEIRRQQRRKLVSTKQTFKLSYERSLSSTLKWSIDGGVYTNTDDRSDLLRANELPEGLDLEPGGKSDIDGWVASTTLSYNAGRTRYEGRFAVDVEPSSSGTQVETNELVGTMQRELSPRLDFSLRARAFEPDRLVAQPTNDFARRFISFEPRIQWKYTRNWTLSAAYRYRRQRARTATVSAESNAILLAIKYTHPSKVRDAEQANGL